MKSARADIKRIALVMVVGVAVILGYYGYRYNSIEKFRQELREVQQKITDLQRAELELVEMHRALDRPTDLVDFIEELYQAARIADLIEHDVTTSTLQQINQTNRRRQQGTQGEGLKKSRIQVNLEGRFQNIANYLQTVQSSRQFKRVAHFEMSPGQNSAKMVLLLDLYQTEKGEPM